MASETHGSILLSTADSVSRMLMKKLDSQTGFKPSEWTDNINLLGALPIRTASGTIAHFSDGADDVPMKSITANITPIQDLHGYSKPWAAGAGKNKLNLEDGTKTVGAVTMTIASGKCTFSGNTASMSDFSVLSDLTLVDGVTYTLSGTPSGAGVGKYRMWVRRSDSVYYNDDGAGVSFTFDNSYTYEITIRLWSGYGANLEFKPQIEEGSTATAYEPYENICPISGTDELTLIQTGFNIFGKKPFSDWVTKSPHIVLNDNLPKNALLTMVFIDKDTSVDISGCYLGFVKDTYNGGTVQNEDFHWTLQNGTVRGRTDNVAEIGTDLCNCLMMYPTGEATYNKIFSRFDIMVVVGASTATDFEPYNAETYTFDLGQEIMGGSADVVGGTGTKNKTARVLNGTEAWFLVSSGEYTTVFALGSAMSVVDQNEQICSHFNFNSQANAVSQSRANTFVQETSGNLFIQVSNDLATTVEGFKSWLASEYANGTPVTYVAKTTPTEYTFTGKPIESLLGVNNVWTDSGEVLDVEYRADIDLLIAELEN